jgi:sugar lactone lactonase YvrE
MSGSTHTSLRFSSDCDWSGTEGRLLLHLQSGPNNYFDVLSIGTEQWMRSSDTGGAWQTVSAETLTEGPLSIFLPEVVLQPRYVAGLAGLERVRTTSIQSLGATVVGDSPVWHLRLRWKHGHQRFALHVYVDQSSGLWPRKTTRETGPKPSDVLVIDTHYSRFNDPVTINPPPSVQGGGNAPPSFQWPGGLAIDASGDVYLADGGNSRIVTLTPDGKVKRTVLLDLHDAMQYTEPDDVAVGAQGNLYVVFWMHHLLMKLGPDGTEVARFDLPDMASAVELDNEGHVWIVTLGGRVEEFSATGDQLATWQGDFGGALGPNFAAPDFAFDGNDHLYFTDKNHHRIQEFSPDGKLLAQWGQKGKGLGQFETAWKIAIDPKGYVYVVDEGTGGSDRVTGRVEKFTLEGKPLLAWKAGPFSGWDASAGIAVDAAGNVYVAGDHQVQKFSSTGQLLATWG